MRYLSWRKVRASCVLHSPELQTNKTRLQLGKIKVQCFAIFLEPDIPSDQKFHAALEQIDYFYKEVIGKNPDMIHVKDWSTLIG